MKDKKGKVININRLKIPEADYPISFICGKDMIEKVGIIEPEFGVIIYLFKESEVQRFGTKWLPKLPESSRVMAMCLPDSITYKAFSDDFYKNIEETKPLTWKKVELEGIKNEQADKSST